MRAFTIAMLAAWMMTHAVPLPAQDEFSAQRARMLAAIESMARETGAQTGRHRFGPAVMAAMNRIPRHRFVPPALQAYAYENRPLPIGDGQTISQPYMVALMSDLLDLQPAHVVLEIGTGSGYQAAVLAELAARVYTIEIIESLGARAARTLQALGYRNVQTRIGDGYRGWPEAAPFDAIVVTAAAPRVPPPLLDQLKPGGRMVIPLGGRFEVQELQVIEKSSDGRTTTRRALPVRFVPLTGDAAGN